ncbi:MAG: TSUP family transporter [Rhodocyclaceae bacterium]
MTALFVLCAGAFFAGMVDAIVGGGGLIQVPLLFSVFPGMAPATLFGTNKLSSVWGTAFAAGRYGRRVRIPWRIAGTAAGAAVLASYMGAYAVALVPTHVLRPVILGLLVFVTAYTLFHKDFGLADVGRPRVRHERVWALGIGCTIGFYDGFFGPGAGTFLVFLFVRFVALDFLRASATAKIVNVSTNLAALSYFVPNGHLLWSYGLVMALFNVAGSYCGSHLALRYGSGFVRKVFLGVAVLLIGKFAADTLVGT